MNPKLQVQEHAKPINCHKVSAVQLEQTEVLFWALRLRLAEGILPRLWEG